MDRPFYIVGPTAVGKTGLAVAAAERIGAEIVNADAFQVYAGLDLLTAKPSADESRRARHHLIGCVSLSEAYNVARYREDAGRCLQEIAARGKPVIVVGGSGLYIKALTHGLSPLPPAQPELRAELEATELAELLSRLQKLDPVAAETIDARNKRRVVRAVEVCVTTGRRFSEQRVTWENSAANHGTQGVFLIRNKDELSTRIVQRVKEFITDAGLEEVRQASLQPLSETAARIIGLAEIPSLLRGEISEAECLATIIAATRRYAKRQMTWFRGESIFETINLTTCPDPETVVENLLRQGERRNDGSPRSRGQSTDQMARWLS